MSRILGPFRKRVLQFAASFPVIVTQKYLSQFSKRDVWNLNLLLIFLRSSWSITHRVCIMTIVEREDSVLEKIIFVSQQWAPSALRADVSLFVYTWKMKTVSEESIRGRLGYLNFKIPYIRRTQTSRENSTTFQTPYRRKYPLFLSST